MSYARKEERFWTDPELRKIDYTSRYLFDWFFTNPQRHFSGVYFYEKVLIPVQTGIPLKLIDKSIKELQDHGFIKVCERHSTVFVVNMFRHQTGNKPMNEKQTIGIKNHFESLHCSCFKEEFNNKYKHLFCKTEISSELNLEPIDTPLIPHSDPTDTKSQSQSQSNKKIKTLSPPTGGNGVDADFEKWWEEYPRRRRKGKPVVLAKWRQLHSLRKLPPIAEMIATLKAQKGNPDWIKDGGEYIPGPLPYLNKQQFLDDSIFATPPGEVGPCQCRDPDCPRCRGQGTFKSGEMPDGSPAFAICYGVKKSDDPETSTAKTATA